MPTDHPLAEHDVVELLVAHSGWPAGTKGAVLSVYDGAVLVEVADAGGHTRDTLCVSPMRLAAAGA
jgi:hypothetical protein